MHILIEPVELVCSACYNRLIKHHTFLPFIIKPSFQTDDNICTLKTQSSHVLTFSWCYLFFDEWIFDSISVGYYRFFYTELLLSFSCTMIYDVMLSASISFIKKCDEMLTIVNWRILEKYWDWKGCKNANTNIQKENLGNIPYIRTMSTIYNLHSVKTKSEGIINRKQ